MSLVSRPADESFNTNLVLTRKYSTFNIVPNYNVKRSVPTSNPFTSRLVILLCRVTGTLLYGIPYQKPWGTPPPTGESGGELYHIGSERLIIRDTQCALFFELIFSYRNYYDQNYCIKFSFSKWKFLIEKKNSKEQGALKKSCQFWIPSNWQNVTLIYTTSQLVTSSVCFCLYCI